MLVHRSIVLSRLSLLSRATPARSCAAHALSRGSASCPPLPPTLLHGIRPISSSAAASSSSAASTEGGSISNPLLGIDVAAPSSVQVLPEGDDGAKRYYHKVKGLPVSMKKLTPLANFCRRLYWREAMLQMEFHRKNIAIHVKNSIDDAMRLAEEKEGLDPTRTIVDQIVTGKGTYVKMPEFKAKGRTGTLRKKQAHLYIILKEVSEKEIMKTKFYNRWQRTARLLAKPWAERVKELPRYVPIPGYDPGHLRVQDTFGLLGEELQAKGRNHPSRNKSYRKDLQWKKYAKGGCLEGQRKEPKW